MKIALAANIIASNIMASLIVLIAGISAGFAQDADARLNAFFSQYLEETFKFRPLEATRLGDHRFDNLLDDISPQARKNWIEHSRKTLEELPKQVDYEKLSRDGKIDFEIFQLHLKSSIWNAENIRPFELDPRTYNAYINDSVYVPLTQSTLPKETNISNAIARMKLIPEVIAEAKRSLQNPPAVVTETAVKQNLGSIGFYERDIFQIVGATPQMDALKAAAKPVVESLKQYQQFLEKDLLPRAHGEWRLGREKFGEKLRLDLEAEVAPEQVSGGGRVGVRPRPARYVYGRPAALEQIFPQTGAACGRCRGHRFCIEAVLEKIGLEHGKPEDLVPDARANVQSIKKFIAERDILRLPEPDNCQVVEMPEFKRGNSTAYCEPAPPLDPKAVSFYAVSPPPKDWDAKRVETLLREYNSHMMHILTIHEAYPGHFVQLEYAHRNPSLVRRVLESGVYIEGWAVYTEQMMLDQGYGGGDLALRLTQQKFYLRAVANAILDYKMHCAGMTDEEALKFLVNDAYQSEGEARLKIIRASKARASFRLIS